MCLLSSEFCENRLSRFLRNPAMVWYGILEFNVPRVILLTNKQTIADDNRTF